MKILIIDDSADALAIAKVRLREEGHEILCASSGAEGLVAVAQHCPDLILLDLDMPGMNGFEVCHRLKSDSATCSIPIIFLSGSDGTEDKVKGLDMGAVDYVTKPFDAFELRARVRAALRTKRLQDMLRDYALIDPLTELPNRRALGDRMAQEWARMLRYGRQMSLIMADIDHFKLVNDRHGHHAGDEALRQTAHRFHTTCRRTDALARYGGEEFVVVAPETGLSAAMDLAERLRESLCSSPIKVQSQAIELTASFGVAASGVQESVEGLLAAADKSLYQAKTGGRNCVRACSSPAPVAGR